jgi:hypothetical protein
MSEDQIKLLNKVWKGFVITIAAIVAIVAICENVGHLFTAAVIFAVGLESEIVKKEDYERY